MFSIGSFKEIVSLIPVNNVNGNELTSYTKEICKLVTACDFKIIAIITDNNRVNRVMFKELSSFDNNFTYHFSNTFKTFLTYDTYLRTSEIIGFARKMLKNLLYFSHSMNMIKY